MRARRIVPLVAAGCLLLLVECHVIAVPVASRALRPPFPALTPADQGLLHRDRLFRGAHGARLPAWEVAPAGGGGSRGIVVLLAENGSNRAGPRMLWLAREVAGRGWGALLVDLRGHGESGGVNTYGLGETLDLIALLAALRREDPDRPVAAVGFSLGAACILRSMSVTDTIRGAVVFAPYSRLDRELLRHELAYQSFGTPLAPFSRLLSPRLLLAALRLWSGLPRLPEPAELVTDRPVLLFHCIGDPEIPFAHALRIVGEARAPFLELRPLARAAHIPPLEDAEVWESFAGALGALLDRSLPAARVAPTARARGASESPP